MLDQTPSPAYITLFGRFRYHRQEGDQWVALRLTKTDASILTVLLLTPGQTRPRDELATLLYGDANLNNLKQRLLGLEGRLGEQRMRLHWKHSQDVRFDMRGVTVDVFEFEDRAIRLGSSATYLTDWQTARQLRTGPLVQVLELRRDCLKQKRRSLDGKYQALLAKLAFAFRVLNRAEEVVSCLSERAECFPSENDHWRDLLATLVTYNRLEEAEAAYSRYREHRQGSADTPEIGELRSRIFADGRTPPSAGHTLPGRTIPPAQSVTLTTRSLLTRPVGREAELARLRDLVASGTRLITLTGPGGIGKTTLAHMAASDVSGAFENGAGAAYFGGVDSMETALAEFIRFQGVSLAPKEPIVNALARLHCLLILDNCEHLVDGVAEFVRSLAQTCPRVQIIATSRQAIGIPGEQICPVPPLSLPEDVARHPSPEAVASALERSGAAQVFAVYARAAQPDFSITSQNARAVYAICAKLEGIPLAIQIAASQMRYLTESEIARGVDDRLRFLRTRQRPELPQHQSVRASLDFSCNLLPDGSARDLLPLLSAFDGSFTAAAAQTICRPSEPDASKFLDDLNALVDLSLVSPEAGDPSAPRRYSMLGLLRDYARELVPDGQGDALRERHFRFFLALAGEQASLLGGSKQTGALEALGAELRNLHAAAQWCMDRPAHAQGGLELAVALSPFWMVRGHYADGSKLIEGLLAAAGLESGTLLRAHALNAAGKLAYALGQYAAAKRHYIASRELYRVLDDFKNMANPVSNLGVVLCETGEYREGYQCHNQALELRRRFNPGLVMASLNNLARQHYLDKDLTSADAIWTQALELAAHAGDTANIALIKSNLCAIAIESGDLRKARTLLTESLDIRVLIGNPEGIASVLDNCAVIAGTEHQWGRAVALRGASGMLRASTGTTWSSTGLASMQETVRDATAQIGEQEVQTHWERGESMTPAEAVRYARECLASSGERE